MKWFILDRVLLPDGWASDIVVTVDDEGIVRQLEGFDGSQAGERVRGVVLPGMPNAHSHAFQMALAGRAEARTANSDSFWTWRDLMYRTANAVDPETLHAIALHLFVQMLRAGYTAVAEFHYVHNAPDGTPYDDPLAMSRALLRAAEEAGIAITLLPTLYQHGDFGGAPPTPEQRRFLLDDEAILARIAGLMSMAGTNTVRAGIAFHSLRAVSLECIERLTPRLRDLDPGLPIHIHVAEQTAEVDGCLARFGRRPIELLAEHGLLSDQWCLVHATHATESELAAVADAGATVCICPTTEANLGDGFFDLPSFQAAGGRWSIGSDSQISLSPPEELRWLDYGQRLLQRKRSVSTTEADRHPGTRLWRDAAAGGAQALGQPIGAIDVGRRADWLVLDPSAPTIHGGDPDRAADALVFVGQSSPIRDVMVAGRWVVRDGHHPREIEAAEKFRTALSRLSECSALS